VTIKTLSPILAGAITIEWQPIVEVASGRVVAAEALARFPNHATPTSGMFDLAHAEGVGPELEAACLRAMLRSRSELPPGVLATVNVSPKALCDPAMRAAWPRDLRGILVELTEQATAESATALAAVAELRERGAQLAVDDASTGYAGLLRLAHMRPDVVKLDRSLVAGAGDRVEQSAVIEALVSLARRIGARVVGEGVENIDDLTQLAALDVDCAQGWAIAAPARTLAPVSPSAIRACRRARTALLAGAATNPLLPGSAGTVATITAGLAGSRHPSDLHTALEQAAVALGVDTVSLSVLTGADESAVAAAPAIPDATSCPRLDRAAGHRFALREFDSAGDSVNSVDTQHYLLRDFPATASALHDNVLIEAHTVDAHADAAERALLTRLGFASLLLIPIRVGDRPLGVLEYCHRSHRRWTLQDITHARLLAAHLAGALARMPQPLRAPVPGRGDSRAGVGRRGRDRAISRSGGADRAAS
jgi:EAL domain-containing protein (putative c-di-GMP-specific phosphodiesterase class I)